jgi:hypothetical protein
MGRSRRLRVLVLLGFALLCGGLAQGAFAVGGGVRTVRFHGLSLNVPVSWPVVDLSRNPDACVRFDRHAVYLGIPGLAERCPAHAVGRTDALLIEPAGAGAASQLSGNARTFLVRSAGVRVTATWSRSPRTVAHALGRAALPGPARVAPARGGSVRSAPRAPVYTGLGFDRCTAPSSAQMSAWASSPYRAVGIYIGGANSACLQPNLTSNWVKKEITAGWHPIPLYVGLQAPSNGCGCQAMSGKATKAKAQGRAAATDAVAQAQRLGIPAGNPIYNDMEGYTPTKRNTGAVLAFLSGWTAKLHADGYVSGVYSSASSGIRDLAARYGTGYLEPDDIWIADWNGKQSTADPYVPKRDWPNHQRLHQYAGGSTETYGKVTLNVDDDYLDGATASARDGYTLLTSNGAVHAYGSARLHGSDAGKLAAGVTAVSLAVDTATGGYWILKSNGGVDNFHAPGHGSVRGGSTPVAIAAPPRGGYLILTSDGAVRAFGGAKSFGSDAGKLPAGVTAVSLAVDPRSRGYWILKSNGGVDNFNAPWKGSLKHKLGASAPVAIAAPPHGGYLILLSNGGVHKFGPAASFGSDAGKLPSGVSAVSLATSPALPGYRVLRSDGGVDSFDATWAGSLLGSLPSGVRPVTVASGG